MVIARCTCGAVLPDDARFCHKCGKPQVEAATPPPEDIIIIPEVAPKPAEATPTPINFHNFAAVRVAFLTALGIFLLNVVPFPALIKTVLVPVAGGFLSVYLYQRWTGQGVNLRGGATLGWITGIFCFMIAMVLFTLLVLILSQPDAVAMFRQQLERHNKEEFEQLARVFQNRDELAQTLASVVLVLFVVFTLLPMIGGALGAKVLQKQ